MLPSDLVELPLTTWLKKLVFVSTSPASWLINHPQPLLDFLCFLVADSSALFLVEDSTNSSSTSSTS